MSSVWARLSNWPRSFNGSYPLMQCYPGNCCWWTATTKKAAAFYCKCKEIKSKSLFKKKNGRSTPGSLARIRHVCGICQKWRNPPVGYRGAWLSRGITDWNLAIRLLKQHANFQWHRDAAATGKDSSPYSVVFKGCKKKLLNWGREIAMNQILHMTPYPHLIELQLLKEINPLSNIPNKVC